MNRPKKGLVGLIAGAAVVGSIAMITPHCDRDSYVGKVTEKERVVEDG